MALRDILIIPDKRLRLKSEPVKAVDNALRALIVARLEDELGSDPFTASEDAYFPVTLGDFIRQYENGAR